MAIAEVETSTASESSDNSITVSKPSGTSTGHLMLAFFTSNSQNCTPPAGWTEIVDEVVEVFRMQIFYKVAGSSEPDNYTFSVGSAVPLVCSIVTLSGIDSSNPIDISPEVESQIGNHTEPYTTPSVSGGTGGRLLYFRAVRRNSDTPLTFSASGASELADVGAANNVAYSQGIYLANDDYLSAGSKPGLAITCNNTETHNIVGTIGIRAITYPATLTVDLPLLDVDMAGHPAVPAEVDIGLPEVEVAMNAFHGDVEGDLGLSIPVSVEMTANTPPAGVLDVVILPTFWAGGETRWLAENVVVPEREERWLIMTQEGYRLGERKVVFVPFRARLPLIRPQFTGDVPPFGWTVYADVEAEAAMVATTELLDAEAQVGVTAYAPTINNDPPHLVDADPAAATVGANNSTVVKGIQALAGHATVTCHN